MSAEDVQETIERLKSDLSNLDPAVHEVDLEAATELALADLACLEARLARLTDSLHEIAADDPTSEQGLMARIALKATGAGEQ